MSGIFLSYRRSGSSSVAYRLADELKRAFGDETIFIDVESIDPGVKFAEAIQHALGQCTVTLVVIGPQWLGMANDTGQRRLDDPRDWVRQEIVMALKSGTRLIPVLVEAATEPKAEQLPPDIADLADLQVFSISDSQTHWAFDVGRLIEKLRGIDPNLPRAVEAPVVAPDITPPPHYSYKVLAAVGIALLVGLTALVEGWKDSDEILGAAVVLAACIALCIAGYRDIKSGKTVGKGGAIAGIIFCGLVLLGSLAGLGSLDGAVDSYIDATVNGTESSIPPETLVDAGQPAPRAIAPVGGATSAAADFGGLWHSVEGVVYQFERNGSQVSFHEYNAFGVEVGQGAGSVNGDVLQFDYYNSFFEMNTQGSASVDGDTMTLSLINPVTGQHFSYEVYRQ